MRPLRWPTLVGTLLCLIGCLGDPVGPGSVLVVRRLSPVDSILVGAPGRPLPMPITFQAVDGAGRPVPGASVQWTVVGTNGRVEQSSNVTDATGLLSAVWVLGTRASDPQGLSVRVAAGNHEAVATLRATAKPVEASSIAFRQDTTTVKLGVATVIQVQATDPFGNHFIPREMRFVSLDTVLCTVDSLGSVQARKRGFGRVVVQAGAAADTGWVHPTQVVQAIIAPDTLRFHSLGQVVPLSVQLLDDLGRPVGDSLPVDSVVVDTVVKVQRGSTYVVRSLTNGTTPVILRAGPVAQTVQVVVDQRVARVKLSASRVSFDALVDTTQLTTLVLDSLGATLTNQALTYSSADTFVAKVSPSGLATTRGNGSTWLYARASNGVADSVAVAVAQQVARVEVRRDSILLEALQAVVPMEAIPVDRLGSPVTTAALTYATGSPSVAFVDQTGNIRAIANGATTVTAAYGIDSARVSVRVAQRPVRILVPNDTIRFVALGETQPVQGIAVDSLGYAVSSVVQALQVTDTTVVQQVDSVTVRSHANGLTRAAFTVGGLTGQVTVAVSQAVARIAANVTFGKPIVTMPVGAIVPMSCQASDRNGYPVAIQVKVASAHGTVTSGGCDSVTVARSGFDTLFFSAGGTQTIVPLLTAAAPVASSPLGQAIIADSIRGPWAPSVHLNAAGQLEVYYSNYIYDATAGYIRADLHRLIWLGGNEFQQDGVAISHDDNICSPQGQGIENMTILPRSDSAGFRMLYAAGSFACYGWQVFSAVSADGRTWVKEPGIRIDNGGPGPSGPFPWPAGEGMQVFVLPDGEYQLIAGTFERVTPPPVNQWAITEWRSVDQLHWNYVGPVLTVRDMPAGWQGSVYSPTIREFAPGLWRMIFTTDGRGTAGSRSALWTAVSTDREHWQIEGELLGAVGANVYYSAMAGDKVVFVVNGVGISMATVSMP